MSGEKTTGAGEKSGSLLTAALGASTAIAAAVSATGFVSLEASARQLGLSSGLGYSVEGVANAGLAFWLATVAALPLAILSGPSLALLIAIACAVLARMALIRWMSSPSAKRFDVRRWLLVARFAAGIGLLIAGFTCLAAVAVEPSRLGLLFDEKGRSSADSLLMYATRLAWALCAAAAFVGFARALKPISGPPASGKSWAVDSITGIGLVTVLLALSVAYGVLRGPDRFHEVAGLALKEEIEGIRAGPQERMYLVRDDGDFVVLYDAKTRQVAWVARDGIRSINLGPRRTPW